MRLSVRLMRFIQLEKECKFLYNQYENRDEVFAEKIAEESIVNRKFAWMVSMLLLLQSVPDIDVYRKEMDEFHA